MSKQNEIIKLATDELPQLKAIIKLNATPGTDVETLALQELQYLQMIGLNNPAVYECEPATIVMAIKSVLKKNLTLDPDAGLVYVKTRNYKAGKTDQGKDIWKKALEIQESANGIISVARQCGRIYDIESPEILKDANGKVIGVKLKYMVPSYDDKFRKSTRWKEIAFDESDFERWKRYSHKENRKSYDNSQPQYRGEKQAPNDDTLNYANPLYSNWKGGIDPAFAQAKSIRHGLKKLGTNQNETRSLSISVSEKKIVVDPAADFEAMNDGNASSDYIEHEDVSTSSNGNGVHVTVHEEIPNL